MKKTDEVVLGYGCVVCKRPMTRTVRVDLVNFAVCESDKCAKEIQDMQLPRSDQRAH